MMKEKPVSVLVVEDNEEDMARICSLLPEEQCELYKTDSGKDALAKLMTGCYEMAVIDVELPDGSGLAIVRKVHEAKLPTQLLVITSTHCSYTTATCGLNLGADDYILKAMHNDQLEALLQARIRRILEIEGQRRFVWREFVYDSATLGVYRNVDGELVHLHLPLHQLRLFNEFLRHPGKVLTLEYLAKHVMRHSVLPTNYKKNVHQRVAALRKSLGLPENSGIISPDGGGYVLED